MIVMAFLKQILSSQRVCCFLSIIQNNKNQRDSYITALVSMEQYRDLVHVLRDHLLEPYAQNDALRFLAPCAVTTDRSSVQYEVLCREAMRSDEVLARGDE